MLEIIQTNKKNKFPACWACASEGLTDQEVEKAIKKAIEKGAKKYIGVDIIDNSKKYTELCAPEDFEFFGVDSRQRTYFADSISSFGLEVICLSRAQIRELIS